MPLLDNCKKKSMNAKAAELIGLDLDQFRQVIILPQGKFETLLTSRSEDKESILSSLFHTERWKTAVERMAKELNERENGIAREVQTIREGLERLQAASVEALPEAVENAEKEAGEAAAAEKRADAVKKQAQELLNLKNDYAELDRRLEKREIAGKAAEGDHGLEVRLEMAVRAEKARKPHDDWKQAADDLKWAGRRLEEAGAQLEQAEAALKKASGEKAAHEAQADEQQERIGERQRLSALRGRYENIAALQKAAGEAEKVMNAALDRSAKDRAAAGREKNRLLQLETAWNNAEDEYRRIARAYRAAAAGHLASPVRSAEACIIPARLCCLRGLSGVKTSRRRKKR